MSDRLRRRTRGENTKVFAGRYAYEKPLGRGAGGSVYLARDLREGERAVALKVLSAEACETVQGKMLRREFEILSKLDHPNLVRVYDYGSLPDGGVFLAEEYIDGFSLQDARALFEPAALIELTLQLLHGLSYLHAMGMIHRDIKPANVMLLWLDDASAEPMVKLVDFGLSSMDPKRDTLRGGTRSYMAPEIIRGEKGERRSDLYSLGVTLYYALCGVLPFGPRSKEDPPPTEEDFRPPDPHRLNGEVPLELSRFTMALLRQVPGLDFADAGEALQALAADAGKLESHSVGRLANSLDLAAAPVIRGYFERGILSRRIEEDDLLLEWLSINQGPSMGQMYLIRGERGAGKSRLLQDVQASAKLSGHLVLDHRCKREAGPYSLLLAMTMQIVELARSQDILAVEKYDTALGVRRLLSRLGVVTPGENVAPIVEQAWMQGAIEDAVSMLGPAKVVFFIDDIDEADEASLEILREWYQPVKSRHRPDIVATTEGGEVYESLAPAEGVQLLPIEGVGFGDVKAFFCNQLGLAELSDGWLRAVTEAAQGRPAYIEELCRYLIDSGLLRRASATRWEARIADIEAAGVPSSMRESLRRRVTAVGAAGRECLELMALLERPLSWQDARSLLRHGGVSSEEAEKVLQTVHWRNLVLTDLNTDGRFVTVIHNELAEAVADMLSPEWRRALHRRIGELLARRWAAGRGEALEAARHLRKGGREQEAAPYFEIAGDLEMGRGRHMEAADHYGRALEGVRDVSARSLLYLKLARARLAAFDAVGARQHLEKGVERARSAGPEWLLARALVDGVETEMALGDVSKAREYLTQLQDELGDESLEVRLAEADLLVTAGHLDAAQVILERCESMLAPLSGPVVRAEVLRRRAALFTVQAKTREALRLYQNAVDLLENFGDKRALGILFADYGADLRRMGSPVEARHTLQDALFYLTESGTPQKLAETLFQLSWTLTDLGSSTTARRRANEAARFAEMLGHRALEQKIAVLLSTLVLRKKEDRTPTLETIERVIDALDRRDDFAIDRAEVLIGLGEVMVNLQLTEQGPKILQRGRQLAFQIGAQGLLPPVED